MLSLLIFVLILLSIVWLKRLNKEYFLLALCKRVKTKDGSPLDSKVVVLPGKTVFGNNFDVLDMNPETIFNFTRESNKASKGQHYIWHFILSPMYNVTTAEDADEIFQSTSLITKNVIYDLIMPFLGEGLLISTDQKWHFRRKLLTPAFHFKILQSFLEVFKEECNKIVKTLEKNAETPLPLGQFVPQFTLNNICETALGVKLDDIEDGDRYRKAIHTIEDIIIQRTCNPLFYWTPFFYFFGDYRQHEENLKIVHDFSSGIIKKKRDIFNSMQKATITNENTDDIIIGKKKRFAMLDTLLAAEVAGQIDHQGICDEVNTFMFEGFDTTSTCLIFSIFMLALHQDIQKQCYQEVFQLNDLEEITVFDFNQLEYLECVIKETLRMYPSVPFIGRKCVDECEINGLIFPKNTQVNIHIFDIMRDPRHFPEPNCFKPERFLPQNNVGRHPFAFVPFSAGNRNCIGQKFAILEIKAILVAILRNFKIMPVTKLDDVTFENALVLRTKENILVQFKRRSH